MIKRLLFIILSSSFFLMSFAQTTDSYEIEINIHEYQDSVIYLANYYGDKTYLADTAIDLSGKGHFVFSKEKELEGGLYIIVSQSRKSLFEFLVADSRNMKFETSMEGLIENMKIENRNRNTLFYDWENMKIENSNENAIFYDYLRYSGDLYTKVKPINEKLKRLDPESDSSKLLKDELTNMNLEMVDYKMALMEKHPETFLTNFFGLLKDPSIPDTLLTLPDGTKDSAYPYRYYKQHYWDDVKLSDDRLIRTPVFHKKLDTYFDKVILKDADTIIAEIDRLLAQMNEKGDLYKFSLWHLTIKFDESQIMGHDAILVYLSDHYFSKGKAAWLNEGVVKNIMDEADKRRSTIIGSQAPNLIMQDTNLKLQSLYDLQNDFVVLYFWDPQCGHCKEETPKLVDFYKESAKELNLEIFAVCADTNMAKMKDYITKRKMNFVNVNGPRGFTSDYHDLYNIFSTPVVLVLDKKKKIIAKRIQADQLQGFIENYIKYELKE